MSPRDRRGGKIHLEMVKAARNENFAVSFIGPRRDKELRRIQRQAVVIRRMSHLGTFPSRAGRASDVMNFVNLRRR